MATLEELVVAAEPWRERLENAGIGGGGILVDEGALTLYVWPSDEDLDSVTLFPDGHELLSDPWDVASTVEDVAVMAAHLVG